MRDDGPHAPISADSLEIINFFDAHLRDIQFPDVDRNRLAELAGSVREAHEQLTRLSEQARAMRETLDRAQAELEQTAKRGLAYARVYAEGDDELSAALSGLSAGKQKAPSKPKRRSRGRGKSAKTDSSPGKEKPTLPFAGNELTEAA